MVLLTQCHCHHRGTRFNVMKKFCIFSLWSHLSVLTFFPLTGECSEGLDAFRFFCKTRESETPLSRGPIFVCFTFLTPTFLGTTVMYKYGCVTWSPRACHYDSLRRAHHKFLTRCIGWRITTAPTTRFLSGHAYQEGK